jgi:uncharacterized membrane protein (UPF0127 family)
MKLYHLERQRPIVEHLEVAEDPGSRRRGLIGHLPLTRGQGLLIRPSCWVHTFGMGFPIDIAYLGKDGRVLAVSENLAPNRIGRPVLGARCVVEMAAGAVQQMGLKVGDHLEIRR